MSLVNGFTTAHARSRSPLTVYPAWVLTRQMPTTTSQQSDGLTLLTYRDVRRILRCGRTKVTQLATSDPPQLPSVMIGRLRRFRLEDVERYLAEHSTAA